MEWNWFKFFGFLIGFFLHFYFVDRVVGYIPRFFEQGSDFRFCSEFWQWRIVLGQLLWSFYFLDRG